MPHKAPSEQDVIDWLVFGDTPHLDPPDPQPIPKERLERLCAEFPQYKRALKEFAASWDDDVAKERYRKAMAAKEKR